jgi:hypothetical protein
LETSRENDGRMKPFLAVPISPGKETMVLNRKLKAASNFKQFLLLLK